MTKFYMVYPGFTHSEGVQKGDAVMTEEMLGVGFHPLDPKEQVARFGRVYYEPYTPSVAELSEWGLTQKKAVPEKTPDPEVAPTEPLPEEAPETTTVEEETPEEQSLAALDDEGLAQFAATHDITVPEGLTGKRLVGFVKKQLKETHHGE